MLHELLSVLTHVTGCLHGMIDSTPWNCGETKSKPFLHSFTSSFVASAKAFITAAGKAAEAGEYLPISNMKKLDPVYLMCLPMAIIGTYAG